MRNELFFRGNPFVSLSLFYLCGILLARIFSRSPAAGWIYLSALLIFILFSLADRRKRVFLRNLRGLFVFVAMVSSGYTACRISRAHQDLPDGKALYRGIVFHSPVEKEHTLQVNCLLLNVISADTLQGLHEKVRFYCATDSLDPLPTPGDSIVCTARMERIRNRGNPDEFDYAQYMADQGILYSAYLEAGSYTFGKSSGRIRVIRLASQVQKRLVNLFQDYGIREDELGVISALIAGDRHYLDQDTRISWSRAGALHVLAVSGLHVGILYLFLNLVFGTRIQFPWFRMVRLLVILSVLWSYAFMTGLSTSVLRATIMFSLFLVGKNFNRSVSSYNLLAASALIVLLIDPAQLFSTGFQYSYLAVLGILFFQPRLENLLIFRHALPDRIWQLVTVSLAAQMATFPLGLYFFHQFPLYFLLTNIVIIPLVWLIMMAAFLFFLCAPFGLPGSMAAWLLNFLLKTDNTLIQYIANLPGASLQAIDFEWYHLLLSFSMLLLLGAFLINGNKKFIFPLLLGYFLSIQFTGILKLKLDESRSRLILYNLRETHAISYQNGPRHLLITKNIGDNDSTHKELAYLAPFNLKKRHDPFFKHIAVEDYPEQRITGEAIDMYIGPDNYTCYLDQYTLCYFPSGVAVSAPGDAVQARQTLWIIDRYSVKPVQLSGRVRAPDQIVFLGYIPFYLKKAWLEYAQEGSIEIHDLVSEGALKIDREDIAPDQLSAVLSTRCKQP